jgi:uncharacterized protein YeaO (DUF488 family)
VSDPRHEIHVYTARVGVYDDASVLDITRKGDDQLGRNFAPSWALLTPYLRKRADNNGSLTPGEWNSYRDAYIAEMRVSYERNRSHWITLLRSGPEVTLCCFCTNANQCHRTVFARLLSIVGPRHDVNVILRGERRART